jgi:hypothetical protein
MENIAKISIIISITAFAAASATVASVSITARSATPVSSNTILEDQKLIPLADTSHRAAPAMLLPKALDKAVADDIKRRSADTTACKAALLNMRLGMIRLR